MAVTFQPAPFGSVSDRSVVSVARRLRVLAAALTGGLALLVAGTVLAFGAVHEWAFRPLLYATGVLAVLAVARALTIVQLRRTLGRSRFSFHTSGKWLVLESEDPYGIKTWSFDLDRPALPLPPLLLPGLVFAGWVGLQMIPLPPSVADAISGTQTLPGGERDTGWRPVSIAVGQTVTGLTFLAWALVLHVVAASALDRRDAQRWFRRFVTVLGLALGTLGLVQMATGTRLIYWAFKPHEGTGQFIFGPFVNRDHFAFYMLLVTPIAFGFFAEAYRRYEARVGKSANMRRRLVTLSGPDGLPVLYAIVPALACVGSLIATTSRGGLIAFIGGLVLAALAILRRRGAPVWAFAAVFTLMAFSWFGLDRIEGRMRRAIADSPGRTLIWQDALHRMGGRWIGGSGFNTFDMAVSRSTAWALPDGATPWRDPYETTMVDVARAGFRMPEGIPGLWYYREAHNDYVQVLAEAGVVGLILVLWGILRVLLSVRADPWLLAALGGIFMHAFVDFGLQVPAIVALCVALAAIQPRPSYDFRT